MKRLIAVIAMVLMMAGISHAVSVETCVLTFTNKTTTAATATSASGKCAANSANGYAWDATGARTVQIDVVTAVAHDATTWDMNLLTSDVVGGSYKTFWSKTYAAAVTTTTAEASLASTTGFNYGKITVDKNAGGTRIDGTITITITRD